MESEQIEKRLKALIADFSEDEFVFGLLLAYGIPKATVTLLKKGQHNMAKAADQVVLKRKLFFQSVKGADLHATIDDLQKDPVTMRHTPRFIVVTDYVTLLAIDTKIGEQLDIPLRDIAQHYDFFLPWAGIEKHRHKGEHPADRKAAEKMAKLYDGILAENDIVDEQRTHDLDIFLSRLLFCFFAEDTAIFEKGLFTDSVASHTKADGSDLAPYLEKLFSVLNTKEEDRSGLADHFRKFPYVNGGLFRDQHWIPSFSLRLHRIIVECGELDWALINPDIFGSMMQAVTHPGQRASLGMHYTSVPNIMKVIEPLFLDELKAEFEKYQGNKKKLDDLRIRISKMKFFDPACGSGNFLIITYKELRRLEMDIIREMDAFTFSDLHLSQFYGIEIDDFAHEIAKLSLYLAEHQMNMEFKQEFGSVRPTLPLRESGNIVCGNATRIDWVTVCPKHEGNEIFVFGNPPYLGARLQNSAQKKDVEISIGKISGSNNLDYIACWFVLASEYVRSETSASVDHGRLLDFTSKSELPLGYGAGTAAQVKFAFVSTNSICQGSQVSILWPYLFSLGLEISFAHQSFKWSNNAKGNAGITCVIVGLRLIDGNKPRYIFRNGFALEVKNINAYLLNADTVFIQDRRSPISHIPKMCFGSMPNDGGNLVLSKSDYLSAIKQFPEMAHFVRRLLGGQEFLKGSERHILWIDASNLKDALQIGYIRSRIDAVKAYRQRSKRDSTRKLASLAYRFGEVRHKETHSIIIPRVSSERREYIPIGFLGADSIIIDSAQAIYDAEPWIFGVISSRMHMTWVRAVCGSLETRIRYSSALGYNTFPIPTLTAKQKEEITRHVFEVLEERENHSEKTMAQLYDPDKMPDGLREAHHSLDLAVEHIYRSRPFTSDEERLEYLFALYERMIAEEFNS